jgi:hypothetical protein
MSARRGEPLDNAGDRIVAAVAAGVDQAAVAAAAAERAYQRPALGLERPPRRPADLVDAEPVPAAQGAERLAGDRHRADAGAPAVADVQLAPPGAAPDGAQIAALEPG